MNNVKNVSIMKDVSNVEAAMAPQLNAEMISSTGCKTAPIEQAIGAVQEAFCRPQGSSRDVYAVIFWPKHKSKGQPDHLSMMNAVISAAKKSWDEVSRSAVRRRLASKAGQPESIQVVEHHGIRIYTGCASPEALKRRFIPEQGIYIFPSHLKLNTVEHLGLAPLPKEVQSLPIVLQVGIERETTAEVLPQGTDRQSRAWREAFVSQHKCLSAPEVADEAGNTAKNRSAIASRWAAEGRIFGIRFRNQTLYPAFQFNYGEPIEAMADVLKEMPSTFTGWDVAFFLTSPSSYTDGKSPLQLLSSTPERVVALAKAFARPANVF